MPRLERFTTDESSQERLVEIRRLCDSAFAGEFSEQDWEHALGGRHVVVIDDGAVIAHAAVVPRIIEVAGRPFRTGYVEAVVTNPAKQRAGLGSSVMAEVAIVVRDGFEMGALSSGLYDFYGRLGWERWRGPTYVRQGSGLVRTEDDDDGVLVLRFGPSADIDLAATISCEARSGDDW
jgi:aminoglycoside 2'-N-acetyltransferase I